MKNYHSAHIQTAALVILLLGTLFTSSASGAPTVGPYPEMIYVPGSTFQMGKDPDEKGASDESPQHTITLRPYRIAKYEVTNAQYAAALNWALKKGYLHNSKFEPYLDSPGGSVYMRGNYLKRIAPDTDIQFFNGEFKVRQRNGIFLGNHPVVEVTWYGAAAYTNWISELQGLPPCYDPVTYVPNHPESGGYRLPAEAEWERAAGWSKNSADRHRRYATGRDTISPKYANYNFNHPLKAIGLKEYPYTTPVGHYDGISPDTIDSPSPIGCYDMSGNAYEWCQDHFYPYPGPESSVDPKKVLREFRIVRGGSWSSISDSLRTTNRGWSNPGMTFRTFGLRVAQSVTPE
jgi:formylglycine-generating enzyme required for sulfatase activity